MRVRHHHAVRMSRLLAVIAVCAGLADDAAAQGSAETDRAALEALYDATDGTNWTDSTNWKTDAPLDQWHGVTMHGGRVWGVDLSDNGLTGSIPNDLGSLTNVRWLHLGVNELTGPIPEELGNLGNLESLWLWSNALTGPIPTELGNLRNLKLLNLGANELTGPIPAQLGNLTNLERLDLGGKELTTEANALTGPIPAQLGNLANLERLDLSRNALTGPIPTKLGNLRNLKHLRLSENWGITGTLPSGLPAQSLAELDIFFTQTCAPAAWRDWLENIAFDGRLCGTGSVTIDVAVVYTPAAREEAGGTAAIEAVIDLMLAETNQALRGKWGRPPRRVGGEIGGALHRDKRFARPPPSQRSVGRVHGRGACVARPHRGRPRALDQHAGGLRLPPGGIRRHMPLLRGLGLRT